MSRKCVPCSKRVPARSKIWKKKACSVFLPLRGNTANTLILTSYQSLKSDQIRPSVFLTPYTYQLNMSSAWKPQDHDRLRCKFHR